MHWLIGIDVSRALRAERGAAGALARVAARVHGGAARRAEAC
jgi:hypothetical protein